MQVVRDDLGLDREQALEVLDPLAEGRQRLAVLQVADVVARPTPGRPWRGRTCSSARRRRRAAAARRGSGSVDRSPGTYPRERRSDQRPAAGDRAHDRVVGAHVDRAVVDEEEVGDRRASRSSASSSRRRSARRRRCRWSSRAAAPASASSRWCSGEYGSITPRSAERGATARATGAPGAARREHDRPLARRRAAPRRRGAARPARAPPSRSGAISANGFSSRCLRARSARDRVLVVGAARQVVAAEPLDRDDPARRAARGRRRASGIGARRAPARRAASTSRSARAAVAGRRSAGRGSGGRPGRRTRPGTRAHIAKPAIVVSGRS